MSVTAYELWYGHVVVEDDVAAEHPFGETLP